MGFSAFHNLLSLLFSVLYCIYARSWWLVFLPSGRSKRISLCAVWRHPKRVAHYIYKRPLFVSLPYVLVEVRYMVACSAKVARDETSWRIVSRVSKSFLFSMTRPTPNDDFGSAPFDESFLSDEYYVKPIPENSATIIQSKTQSIQKNIEKSFWFHFIDIQENLLSLKILKTKMVSCNWEKF